MAIGRPDQPEDLDPAHELQFDVAEYAGEPRAGLACAACSRPIDQTYYQINGKTFCDGCRQAIESYVSRRPGFLGFAKALLFGLGAALLGAAILYGFTRATGWSVGIISIFVGYMVGYAIRKGTAHRGGLLYQLMAVALTYSAVAWSFAPMAYEQFSAGIEQAAQQEDAEPGDPPKAPDRPAAKKLAKHAEAPVDNVPRGPVVVAVMVIASILFGYAAPFLLVAEGGQGLIMLVIIFFGLRQAWQMTRHVEPAVVGPFRLGDGPALQPGGLADV